MRVRWTISTVAIGLVVFATQAQPAFASGYLDTSFGQHGTVAISVPGSSASIVTALAFGNGGRIWVAANGASYTYLFALTSAGKPDASFNSGQPVSALRGNSTKAFMLLPRSNGGVLVVGNVCCNPTLQPTPVIAAFLANGTVDHAYGNGMGFDAGYTWPPNSSDTTQEFFDAVALPSGAVRVCGVYHLHPNSPAQMLLVGYTPSGGQDTTLGTRGNRFIAGMSDCGALSVDGSGRLVAAGTAVNGGKSYIQVTRLASNGDTDTTYGTNGIAAMAWQTRSIRVQAGLASIDPNGDLLLGLATKDPGQRWMATTTRFDATGSVDTSFGYGGMYRYVPASGSSAITSLDTTRNGKALISLRYATPSGTVLLLARIFDASGKLDGTFGTSGVARVTVVGASSLTDSLGRIVFGGPVPTGTVSYVQRRSG
jgi:uncharacterized delta-60 repeat protein